MYVVLCIIMGNKNTKIILVELFIIRKYSFYEITGDLFNDNNQ